MDNNEGADWSPPDGRDNDTAPQPPSPPRHPSTPSDDAAPAANGAAASSPAAAKRQQQAPRGPVPESLSRLERDVAAKRAAAPVDRARPGAVPVPAAGPVPAAAAVASLSQLERDVLAKAAATAAPAHRVAPTEAPAGSGAASLSRMEQDVLAKAASGAPQGAAVRPGAVAVAAAGPVSSAAASQIPPRAVDPHRHGDRTVGDASTAGHSGPSSLSALERDVVAKTQARQERHAAASSGSHIDGLSRLEQDVLAKASVTKEGSSDRPGAVSVAGAASLEALERDIASKLQRSQDDPRSYPVEDSHPTFTANRPGAVAVSGPTSLAALERDVAAKTCGTRGDPGASDVPASWATPDSVESRPGIVSMVGRSSLEALERDVAIKSQSGSAETSQSADRPAPSERGVISNAATSRTGETVEMRHTAERMLDQNREIPTGQANANDQTTSVAIALNRLEQDALMKHSVAHASGPMHGTAVAGAVGVSGAASLRQLESDVQMKQAGSLQRGGALNQLEADVIAKAGVATSSHFSTRNDLSLLEGEILRKAQTQDNAASVAPSLLGRDRPDTELVMEREPEMLSSMRALEQHILTKPVAQHEQRPQVLTNSLERYGRPPSSVVSPATAPVDSDVVFRSQVAPPVPTEGIQAFVADNVVDATGVAVIASEEDVEKKEWTRQKRLFCFIGIPLVIVIILLVVVPVVVVVGHNNHGATVPTQAPTLAPTLAPTSGSLASLIQQLSSISGEEAFASRDSPQFMAAEWLADEDAYGIDMSTSNPKFLQRYALAVIYFALGGPYWRACGQGDEVCTGDTSINSWLSSTDDCSWYGLTCGTTGLLEEFYFRAASGTETSERDFTMLDGELPYEITLLTKLIEFVADGFQLRGSIADTFSKSSDLQTLIISNNNITGEFPNNFPEENPFLQVISFEGNQMTGAIPSSIGRLSNLQFLQVRGNDFSGPIDSETFASTSSLQRLELQNNMFSGSFPESGYSLTDLEILRLDDTGLQGYIFSGIGQMSNLRELDMSNSKMGGSIPEELYGLESLILLNLHGASFAGTLSNDIALLNQTLQYAYFADNDFTGPIPVDGLGALSNLQELELYGNRLTGAITSDSALCGLVFASQIQYIRTDCSVTCECCAKCVPDQ